jgi:hypothetical protein
MLNAVCTENVLGLGAAEDVTSWPIKHPRGNK